MLQEDLVDMPWQQEVKKYFQWVKSRLPGANHVQSGSWEMKKIYMCWRWGENENSKQEDKRRLEEGKTRQVCNISLCGWVQSGWMLWVSYPPFLEWPGLVKSSFMRRPSPNIAFSVQLSLLLPNIPFQKNQWHLPWTRAWHWHALIRQFIYNSISLTRFQVP